MSRKARVAGMFLFVGLASVSAAGVAQAQTIQADNDQYSQISALQAKSQQQQTLLDQKVGEISDVGSRLSKAQSQVTGAQVRARQLKGQTKDLKSELASQQRALSDSKAEYRARARAAYKGGAVQSLGSILGDLFRPGNRTTVTDDFQAARAMFEGRQVIQNYQQSKQELQNTVKQLNQKRTGYGRALAREKTRTRQLNQRKQELQKAISRIKASRDQMQAHLKNLRLQARERARILKQAPATGGTTYGRTQELKIARNDIVARRVAPISKKEYLRLYKKAAREYGFAKDWYVLAAVGEVESNHGENMGPSSSGALGPMQFLPSTWRTAGVDGNGDGVANIMDPRDAIPAAAAYLKKGGAPENWYAALYSYNHADWYVKEVLGVAEVYRRLAGDNTVGPYTDLIQSSH